MRIAGVDPASGRVLNEYPATLRLSADEPAVPYAVLLADRESRYRLLAFDLDASRGPVGEDLTQLRSWLRDASIPHVVARSGPSGGRHVWIALTGTGAPANLVADIARALVRRLPTLDPSPLLNPSTGCVRPPGAPHRAGGRAELLDGALSTLTAPATNEAQLRLLLEVVGPAPSPSAAAKTTRCAGIAAVIDEAGHRWIPGTRRSLPPRSQAALTARLASDEDASARAWAVLLGAARSHWHLDDVRALVADPAASPGLEHLRAARTGASSGVRVTRSRDAAAAVLERQWDHAVRQVAGDVPDEYGGGDETFPARLGTVVEAVELVQARASSSPGRWARPGGAADRRVLDHVCQIALAIVDTTVDLDIRSLAVGTGVSRETSRTALLRLAQDGWLRQAMPGIGAHAAAWALPSPPVSTTGRTPEGADLREASEPVVQNVENELPTERLSIARSHVDPRPLELPSSTLPSLPAPHTLALRQAWTHRLTTRSALVRHDVFTGRGLGYAAGYVFQHVVLGDGLDLGEAAAATGYSPARVQHLLQQLSAHRLVRPARAKRFSDVTVPGVQSRGLVWVGGSLRHRTTAARDLGVHGVLADRIRTIAVDRDVWAWWRSELEWMHTPVADRPRYGRRGRRPGPDQASLVLPDLPASPRERNGPYPRKSGGQADHTVARRVMIAGGQQPQAA